MKGEMKGYKKQGKASQKSDGKFEEEIYDEGLQSSTHLLYIQKL